MVFPDKGFIIIIIGSHLINRYIPPGFHSCWAIGDDIVYIIIARSTSTSIGSRSSRKCSEFAFPKGIETARGFIIWSNTDPYLLNYIPDAGFIAGYLQLLDALRQRS